MARTLEERLWAKVLKRDGGCWLWQGSTSSGYGHIYVGGRFKRTHRVTYEMANGPIPDGLQISHLCRVTLCCNPAHLEAVTPQTNTAIARFHARLPVGKEDECWEWPGTGGKQGYGQISDSNGRTVRAHRLAWSIYHDMKIPAGMLVCHTCDNPPCCNPAHLFLGTVADNTADMWAKGRAHVLWGNGQDHAGAKLTNAAVMDIRQRAAEGERHGPLGFEFGVGRSTVSAIVRGDRWPHLPLVERESRAQT